MSVNEKGLRSKELVMLVFVVELRVLIPLPVLEVVVLG